MKVSFAKDVLYDQNSWRKLDGFVDLFDEARHLWDVDDIQLIEQSPWIQDNLNNYIGQENLEILQKSYTDELYPNSEDHRHSLNVCVTLQANAEENNLTPEEAKRCLTTPAYVVVENAESDGAFLQTMMFAFKQQNLLNAHKKGWWRIESRGGATEIKKNIYQIQDETIGPLRVFVLVDSDRLCPDDVKPAIQKLAQYCIDKNIPYAVLEKREIENYIPVDLLQGVKNKNTIYRAFLELTQQQRDYYDMKYGFKDKHLSEKQQTLYKHVPQHILEKLFGGFGKNICHLFESKREQFSKDSIQQTCPDNPEELENIFKQIEACVSEINNMNTNTSVVKPEVTHLDDIFEDISSGKLRIPGFQRPFVWDPSDMLDLFDSLYNGYPIGSLLFWETDEKIKSGQQVGVIKVPKAKKGSVTYVLDGQQRLATLYSCLKLDKDFPLTKKQENWRWWIWFDLRNDNFIHVKTEKPEPWLFPVRAIYQTMDFINQARHIQDKCKEDAPVLIEKAERLSQKIRNYKIAIIRVKGSSLAHAVDIFSRLNRKGKKITPDQMVSALSYHNKENGKSLEEYIDEILESLTDYHFNKINRMTIFRAIMAAADTKIHRSDWENIAKKISQDKLSVAAQKAGNALQAAAAFLNKEIGLPGDKLLPYTNQLLLLSEFFRHCPKPKLQQKKILKKWFWLSSLSDWLTSINTTQLNQALEEMQQFAENPSFQLKLMSGKPVAQAFPEQFSSLNSSRLRAFFIFMLTKKPLNISTGEPIDYYKILSENGKNAFAYIFPRLKRPLSSSPANRFLLERIPRQSIKDRLLSIPEPKQEQILNSHGIPTKAYQALKENDAETFLQLRTQHLMELEKNFIQKFGITLS